MLRALRVEGLMVEEYTEPLRGDDVLNPHLRGENLSTLRRISRLVVQRHKSACNPERVCHSEQSEESLYLSRAHKRNYRDASQRSA